MFKKQFEQFEREMYTNTLRWPLLRMAMLVSRAMFLRSKNSIVPFTLTYDLSRS